MVFGKGFENILRFFSHNLFFLVFITLIRFIKDTKNYVKKY